MNSKGWNWRRYWAQNSSRIGFSVKQFGFSSFILLLQMCSKSLLNVITFEYMIKSTDNPIFLKRDLKRDSTEKNVRKNPHVRWRNWDKSMDSPSWSEKKEIVVWNLCLASSWWRGGKNGWFSRKIVHATETHHQQEKKEPLTFAIKWIGKHHREVFLSYIRTSLPRGLSFSLKNWRGSFF